MALAPSRPMRKPGRILGEHFNVDKNNGLWHGPLSHLWPVTIGRSEERGICFYVIPDSAVGDATFYFYFSSFDFLAGKLTSCHCPELRPCGRTLLMFNTPGQLTSCFFFFTLRHCIGIFVVRTASNTQSNSPPLNDHEAHSKMAVRTGIINLRMRRF
jgi:hypothetical protein